MSAGQAKMTLLLELKNKLKSALGEARNNLNSTAGAMQAKLKELKGGISDAFGELTSKIPGLDDALSALTSPLAAIVAGIALIGTTYFQSVKMANEWNTSLRKVNVTAQLGTKDLQGLSEKLLDIGANNTGDLMEVPETFNKIVSAGFDVKTSLAALQPTLLAAKAGFTTAGVAAEAATNIMGSTGITDATKIYDVLFATLNKGKAEFEDIANYLPKIIPGARQLGVSLEETGGAFAFLTATGLKAEAASTALANAMKSLSTPDIVFGSKTKGGFKGLGVDIFDATGKVRDLVSISTDLSKKMAGLTDEQRMKKFASIGLDMESAMAFSKMSQGVDQLKDSIDFVTDSQGQLNKAVEIVKDPLDSWYKMWNTIKVSMIEAGSSILPVLGSIGDWFMNNIPLVKDYGTMILSVAGAWAAYFVITKAVLAFEMARIGVMLALNTISQVAIAYDIARAEGLGVVAAAQWALNAAMNANPIGIIITAIGLLIGGLVLAYQKSQTFRAVLSGIMEVASLLGDIFIGLGKNIIGALTFNPEMFISGAKQAAAGISEIMDGGIKKRFDKGFNAKITEENAAKAAAGKPDPITVPGGVKTNDNKGGKGTGTGGSSSVATTTGTAQQTKNLTINMDAMIKMGDLVSKNPEMANMSKKELEQFFMEIAARMIRNLETSYG